MVKHKKRKREKKFESDLPSKNESVKSTSNGELRLAKRSRHSSDKNSNVGKSEGSKKGKRSQYKSFTESGGKRKEKLRSMEKDKTASHVPIRASKSHKMKGKFRRN